MKPNAADQPVQGSTSLIRKESIQMTDQDDIHSCTAAIPCITVSAGISASIPEIEGFSASASIKASETLCAENDETAEMIRRRTGSSVRQGTYPSTDKLGRGHLD